MDIFRPKPTLSREEVTRGMRMMTFEGMASMGFASVTTSGFLAAFALALGANNFQIGILAALPFITQPLQIPSILLVEKIKNRKAIAIISWFLAQLLWLPIALIPFFLITPSTEAISLLMVIMALRGLLTAVTNCSWNTWIRDLIPQNILGRFFSRRLAMATIAAIAFGMISAVFVDYWRAQSTPDNAIYGYSYVLLFGAIFLGLASPLFMSFMSEPKMMTTEERQTSLRDSIVLPFRDKNFRKLMSFLLSWGFALNMAVPFFAVYMLQRIGLALSFVIGLNVISQVANILFLRVWGPLVDRFGSKAILSVCASLYLLVILGWIFTTMPGRYFLTMPLLVVLHIFAGIAAAGVTLTVSTIGLKLAPQGQATSYLAGSSLATNLGAGLGPIAGGFLAQFFSTRQFTLDFSWTDPSQTLRLGVLNITGIDFLFIVAFFIGLITLNTLVMVREEGEVGREVVLDELMTQTRTVSSAISSNPVMSFLTMFPFSYLRKVPGVDVAMGVTAYQLADFVNIVTREAARGRRFYDQITKSLENTLTHIFNRADDLPERTAELAADAARGAVQAGAESPIETERVVKPAVVGIVSAMSNVNANPDEIVRGVSQGVVLAAKETGVDLSSAVKEMVAAVKQTANMLGLDEKKAETEATRAALEVIKTLGKDTEKQVRESLSPTLLADANNHRE